jgi:O-antigen ligase
MMRTSFSAKFVARFVIDGIVALALIFIVIAFPIPHVDYASLKDLFGSRISTSDAAAASRWSLFPVVATKITQAPIFGHGFGATITYASKDPRILAQGKGGLITTYAFEWGWLEHWVKMGIFGVLAMAYLVWRLFRRFLTSSQPDWVRYAGTAIIIGLAVVHFLTPYLNHPLGFGILLIVEGVISSSPRRSSATL